ncbi:hypothetical protein PHLGIDRAFT_310924 [Phlebiopsis gigantea 11061_1 CR5-6]|uniref:Uncharacterized protein n=1 Tax=Phlebiopsis gigantea (strain 11061_1 CR5-6) TaxID=745531 RepID=A0A0C3RZV8_PHLG1|nr:hypothetical protein PHLGIDRAFT_310924 [Phlebiopsis gigantea 11061_1 CR5-6]
MDLLQMITRHVIACRGRDAPTVVAVATRNAFLNATLIHLIPTRDSSCYIHTTDHPTTISERMDDYSDSSFQIPASSSNFLLAEEDSDFLAGTDITFATPATLRRTRTRSDDRLALAELTPKPRTSRMPVRRSPRKHKATPALPSPVVEGDPSAATEEQPPPDRSFQIPVLRDADAELLTADDSGEMFRAGGGGSFGDTPLARPRSQLTSPAQRATAVIRSLPAEATPETSMPAVPGSSAVPARVEKPPATAPPRLVETGGDDSEQSRPPLAAPSVPFASSAEARARPFSAAADAMDCGVEPGEASSTDVAADTPMPIPALHRKPSNRRDSQVKTQSSAVPSGGNVKPSKLRSRPASTKGLRRPRAAADDIPSVGLGDVSEVNAAIPGGEPSTFGESG